MIGVFSILFLASVVGIFRPFIKGTKRVHFVIAAIVSFIAVGVVAPKSVPDGKRTAATPAATASSDGGAVTNASEEAQSSKWEYSEDKDQMRDTTSRFASVDSDNEIDLDFPYGTVHGQITIRKRPEDGMNVMFSVEKGQILCNAFTNTVISVKFDDKPIQKFSCTSSSDGSTETAFLQPASRALVGLKGAKRTVIEAEFYQKGRQQFVFDTSGLVWK